MTSPPVSVDNGAFATPRVRTTWHEAAKELEPRYAESGFCGFFPPDGWLDLVVELHRQLLPNPDYRIGQVKEKFGGLRFYADNLTDAERELVRAAEEESYSICQDCGSRDDVAMRQHGWVATLCASCDGSRHTTRGYSAGL